MKTTKRILALLLALTMAVPALSGCGSETVTTTAAEQTTTAAESTAAAKELTGVVTDGNGWFLWDENGNITREGRGDTGETGMIAAAKYEASMAGKEILARGGNAVDAAVATAFALGVVEPNASGIGGGGHMLIRTAEGEVHFIEFRGTAPGLATTASWGAAQTGGKAACTPGEVRGLYYAWEHYGSGLVSWADCLAPAIELAETGYYVTTMLHKDIAEYYDKLMADEALAGMYLNEDEMPYETGDLITNPDLAKTMRIIAEQGPDGFYTGEVAEAIVDAVETAGGFMTLEDLEKIEVRELEAVTTTYRGYTLISTPFGGASVLEGLNILENFDFSQIEWGSTEMLNLYGEVFQEIFRDKFDYLGDPDYGDIPLDGVLSKEFAAERAAQIKLGETQTYVRLDVKPYTSVEELGDGEGDHKESPDTTHFSVADADGNMVACTQTITGIFGCGVGVDGYGIVLNNAMSAFNTGTNSNNRVEPYKTPNSCMSPTIVLNPDGEPFLVAGSPGSRHIVTTMIQVLVNVLDYGYDIQDAIDQPRIFNDTEQVFGFEGRFAEAVTCDLTAMGYNMNADNDWSKTFGSVQAIEYKDGVILGGADPRRDGKAIGF